jgi:CYTH domain-containing protein
MAIEIERKFLVLNSSYSSLVSPISYRQGYLAIFPDREIRVRMAGEKSFVTIKSKVNDTTRHEFEYAIPKEDAVFMLENLCVGSVIEKLRYRIAQGELCWEVDEFSGDNQGLVVAEIELPDSDFFFVKPDWIGEEITGDDRYLNAALAMNPYKNRNK